MTQDRITALEEALAHQTKLAEELSLQVANQAERIEVLERRMQLVLKRLAEQEADASGGVFVAGEKPPHY